jgi:hypothetical protein
MPAVLYLETPRALLTGDPVPGAVLSVYDTGTTTIAPIYADPDLSTPLQNPLLANLAGRFPPIYTDTASEYRARCVDENDDELFDVDPIIPQQPFGRSAQPVDDNGNALGSASRTFYYANTSILAPIYSNAGMTVEIDNPQDANSSGVFTSAYIDLALNYRVILRDASGVLIYDIASVIGNEVPE